MFRHMFRTFGSLFTTVSAKTSVILMVFTMALVPVAELLVIRMFSHLIHDGDQLYADDPSRIVGPALIFFLAFAGTRVLHHWSRFARVLAVRRAFRQSGGQQEVASRAAWEWALAFEICIVYVCFIQVAILCGLFIWLDGIAGIVNALIVTGVVVLIARIYDHNFKKQMLYVTQQKPTPTEVGARVAQRIFDSEMGAAMSSVAMAFALASMLYFTLKGRISAQDAVVLLLGTRVLYGQLGQLSSTAMRFGRAMARADGGPADPLDEDDTDDDTDDLTAEKSEAEKSEAEKADEPAPSFSDTKRSELVNRMLADGQAGDIAGVRHAAEVLSRDNLPSQDELRAQHAAEAFAHYARPADMLTVGLLWQIRPFPGVATDWMNPLMLHHFSGNPVSYVKPPADFPHLVMNGRLARQVAPSSIVVGAGAMPSDVLEPGATYVSLRGPLTAKRLAHGRIDRFGDPLALVSRALPVRRRQTNGRIALVRHPEHTKTPVTLPDHMDDLSMLASRPDAIRSFVTKLVQYDGIVTTSLPVMAVCQSFGLPVAPITFGEVSALQTFAYEDHALGLGLPAVQPTTISTDLGATNFDDLLTTVTVGADVLDDIEDALDDAVEVFNERFEDITNDTSDIEDPV